MEWFYALAASLLALATLFAALGRFMSGAADLLSLFKKSSESSAHGLSL
jgi:hypothetical protein